MHQEEYTMEGLVGAMVDYFRKKPATRRGKNK